MLRAWGWLLDNKDALLDEPSCSPREAQACVLSSPAAQPQPVLFMSLTPLGYAGNTPGFASSSSLTPRVNSLSLILFQDPRSVLLRSTRLDTYSVMFDGWKQRSE